MKIFILVIILIAFPVFCMAEQKAITDTGDEVVLYDDGTWKYLNKDSQAGKTIPTNESEFKKGDELSFLLKSQKNNIGLWIDPKKWSFKKAVSNDAAEYELQLKGQDLYGMIITEQMSIPLESLAELAYQNAVNAAPDIKIVHKEYRIVNGNKIIQMQMKGTLQGINLVYFGYYFSNEKGATQILTYTSQGLFDSFRQEAINFLNGLVVN